MSNIQKPEEITYLGSFEEEKERYKPIDMIDFSIEYLKALQANKPLNYTNLSGLEKYELHPSDQEIIERLEIPEEDLRRVQERRITPTKDEIYNSIGGQIKKFKTIDTQNEDQMFQYKKFKTNSYKENEFLRFIDGLENRDIDKENNRIYFTKLYNLNADEKNLVFEFLENDYNLLKNEKIKDWKDCLQRLENAAKQTYHTYDTISPKLEEIEKKINNNEQFNLTEFEEISKDYLHYVDELNEKAPDQIYEELIKKPQFEREIIYLTIRIKKEGNPSFEELFKKVDEIYNSKFAYLSKYDKYDYILSCFIPLLKNSDKTSIEHKEMESFLSDFLRKIEKFIYINFLEEKRLYYNMECIKYLLLKESKVKDQTHILIDIIKMFINNINYLKEVKNAEGQKIYPSVVEQSKLQYNLLNLQLKEFYGGIVTYIEKVVSISAKHDIEAELDIKNSLICEFKSYSNKEQQLILNSLKMSLIFEPEEEKQMRLDNTYKMLSKMLSVPEKAEIIKDNRTQTYKEILDQTANNYYTESIKNPKYNFKDLEYIDFNVQSQVVSLIFRNNNNLKNTATTYENQNITPNINYCFMIDKLYNFNLMFFKLFFEKEMREQLIKEGNELIEKMKKDFEKEYKFIEEELAKEDKNYDVEKFKTFGKYPQKLILTYLNFHDNFQLTNEYYPLVNKFSVVYLKEKVEYIRSKLIKDRNLKKNQIFLDSLYDELKHVDYPIFIYVRYDKSIDSLKNFDNEHKEIVKLIMQAESLNANLELPNFLSFEEMLKAEDNIVQEQLAQTDPLVKSFLDNFDNQESNAEELNFDFSFFKRDQKEFIINYLQKLGKNASSLKIEEDLSKDEYKKIVLCEIDKNASEDVKIFYRKKLLEIQKNIQEQQKAVINNVLEFPYDPNNTYLYENFNGFTEVEKNVVIQSIFALMKIMNYHTLYFDNLIHLLFPCIFANLLKLAKKYPNEASYQQFIKGEFEYLLNFYSDKVTKFLKTVLYTDHMTIFRFTRDFSENERDIILLFLELFAELAKDEKYTYIKENLDEFKKDLTYEKRIEHIQTQLDEFINDKARIQLFMLISEEIKETFYEADYIIQGIIGTDDSEIDPFILRLFKTLPDNIKDIIIQAIQCINKINFNENIKAKIDKLEEVKGETENFSIFNIATQSFNEVKSNFISAAPNEKDSIIEKYKELKENLKEICGDLFLFCDECKNGNVSLRKINAISAEKFEIIKLLLDCEYCVQKTSKLKESIEYVSRIKQYGSS